MPSARSQDTANGSKPKPRINKQNSRNWLASKSIYVTTKTVPIAEHSRNSRSFSDFKHFACSTCQKCVFNANHDTCVTKFLNEVNSRAKVLSNKTTNRNKPVEQISVAKKLERQIPIRHRFSIKKTSIVHEKTTSPRSCLRYKQTGRIFKTVGFRWVPTRKIFTTSTTTFDSETLHGSNTDIINLHECIQTLDSSAGTSINVQEEHNLDLSAGTPSNLKKERIKACIKANVISGRPRVILFSIHSDEWKSFQSQPQTALRSYALSWKPCQGDSLNLPDHRYKRWCCSLIPVESDSLPQAHAQTTKTYYKHQDSIIKKAQELKTKTSANSDIQDLPLRYQVYQGRLLASFQDDAKYEHENAEFMGLGLNSVVGCSSILRGAVESVWESAWYTSGQFPFPSDTQSAKLYTLASKIIGEANYNHYEVSRYSKDGCTSTTTHTGTRMHSVCDVSVSVAVPVDDAGISELRTTDTHTRIVGTIGSPRSRVAPTAFSRAGIALADNWRALPSSRCMSPSSSGVCVPGTLSTKIVSLYC
ncbi:hypothetical protein Tco_0777246 [Tanacetum coccineum]